MKTLRTSNSQRAVLIALFVLSTCVSITRADCRADWNRSCVLDTQDIFDFLNEWFLGNGDYNGDGLTEPQDIFDFLNAWFEGCPPGIVRLKIYRVLRSPGDVPCGPTNAGSRLCDDAINNIVAHLQGNASVFGPGVVFYTDNNPDGTVVIQDIYSQLIPANTGVQNSRSIFYDTMFAIIDFHAIDQGFYDNESYNIYFVGDIYNQTYNSPTNFLSGANYDPRDEGFFGTLSKTIITDGGLGDYFAFPTGFEPPFLIDLHILHHETGHHLGRLDQPILAASTGWPRNGTPQRFYDGTEHQTVGPVNNLMIRTAPLGGGYPLIVPGDCADVDTELGQMFDKSRSFLLP